MVWTERCKNSKISNFSVIFDALVCKKKKEYAVNLAFI